MDTQLDRTASLPDVLSDSKEIAKAKRDSRRLGVGVGLIGALLVGVGLWSLFQAQVRQTDLLSVESSGHVDLTSMTFGH
jgi:hypothetical protein